ncbi:TPA: phage tail protein [Citrobacter freundii]
MADYYSIITNRGKELEAEALASGRLIVLTHFVVGDSNGKQVKPDPSQIRLINETYRGDISELVVSPERSTQLMAKIVLPTGVGGFTVREVGLMTDSGELYAVANCPSIDKPVGGVSVNMQFRLAVSDTSNITLNVATGDGLFLRIDQNLKEIKARGTEAQKTSRESIGVLDGTTQQRGLVQLSSSVNSTSETQAATPAAVKIAMDNANARLAKGRNGSDIPDPALFVQNIGLQDTVNKAAGALQKGQNLSDIPDKEKARTALQLGSAATATLTTSKIDNTSGRVLKVGDFGLGTQTYGVIPDSRQVSERSAYGVSFSRVYKSPDAPRMDTYFNLLMLPDTLNGAFSALAMSNNETPIYRAYGVGSNNSTNWVKIYDEKNKPTPEDIGALPTSGGKVTGPLEIESDAPCTQLTETDTGKKYFIVVDNGNIRINQDTLSGVNSILSFDTTTKDWILPGGVIPKKYDNYFSLFQKINKASLGTNGWFEDTNTGLIIQYGIGGGVGAPKNYPIQFPQAFPNRCINIQVTLQSTSWDVNSGSAMGQIIDNTLAYCWSTHSFFWFAIGR